jgi:hypothetical protein
MEVMKSRIKCASDELQVKRVNNEDVMVAFKVPSQSVLVWKNWKTHNNTGKSENTIIHEQKQQEWQIIQQRSVLRGSDRK